MRSKNTAAYSPRLQQFAVRETGAHITGHVEHIRFYPGALMGYIESKPIGQLNRKHSWWKSTGVDEKEWAATRQRLRTVYQQARGSVKDLEGRKGEDDIGAPLVLLVPTTSHPGAIRQVPRLVS